MNRRAPPGAIPLPPPRHRGREHGSVVLKLPLAPGATPTLWQNDGAFQRTYLDVYPGYYHTAGAR